LNVDVLQENLSRALSLVTRAVDSRPTLPVLANVRLEARDASLTVSATNLELSISTTIGAKVQTPGAVTLPAKTFSELVANLSPERVTLTLEPATSTVKIACGTTQGHLKGLPVSEFPLLPTAERTDLALPGDVLKQMIGETLFAAAKEDNRPILTGLYFALEGDTLTMAAADGYRLALRTARLDGQLWGPLTEMVIPARSLAEVARMLGDDDVCITLPDPLRQACDTVIFQSGATTVTTQLIDGRFPDFGAIIPKSYSTAATVYTTDLLRACKRAEIFARDSANSVTVRVTPSGAGYGPGEVMVAGKSAERGDNEGVIDASVEGEPLETSFNVRYLIDALNAVSEERVVLESNGPAHPGVLKPEGREDWLVVTMPMSITR
jgi:DNA polymerase-3 subunit beta